MLAFGGAEAPRWPVIVLRTETESARGRSEVHWRDFSFHEKPAVQPVAHEVAREVLDPAEHDPALRPQVRHLGRVADRLVDTGRADRRREQNAERADVGGR